MLAGIKQNNFFFPRLNENLFVLEIYFFLVFLENFVFFGVTFFFTFLGEGVFCRKKKSLPPPLKNKNLCFLKTILKKKCPPEKQFPKKKEKIFFQKNKFSFKGGNIFLFQKQNIFLQ
jgi:hypothetical protein